MDTTNMSSSCQEYSLQQSRHSFSYPITSSYLDFPTVTQTIPSSIQGYAVICRMDPFSYLSSYVILAGYQNRQKSSTFLSGNILEFDFVHIAEKTGFAWFFLSFTFRCVNCTTHSFALFLFWRSWKHLEVSQGHTHIVAHNQENITIRCVRPCNIFCPARICHKPWAQSISAKKVFKSELW